MGELESRWEAIKEDNTATVAQSILASPNRNQAYLEAIEGKTQDQILALQISLYAYHPEGNDANYDNWQDATVQDFETFIESNASFQAITAPAPADPAASTTVEAGLRTEGNTITITTADGHTVQLEYRFHEDAFRESEYGFRIKVDGETINGDRIGVGPASGIAMEALQANRDAVIRAMSPILQERIRMTDSGDADVVNVDDIKNVLEGMTGSIESVNGTVLEVVDSLSVLAMREAVQDFDVSTHQETRTQGRNGQRREVQVDVTDNNATTTAVRDEFLASDEFIEALGQAEAVLGQSSVAIDTNPVVLARERYDFLTKMEGEDPTEAHDPNALTIEELNTEWAKFHGAGFDHVLSATELEAVALANVLFRPKADGTGWEWDPDTTELSLEQAQAHPDYAAVMEAHAAFETAPSITIAAGTAPAALSITSRNLDDPAALTAYLEAHGAEIDQQIKDLMYGTADDDGVTMDEASAAMDKINAQLETVTAGSLEETILKRAAETINQDWDAAYMAEHEADDAAEIDPAAGGDPRIETETGGDPAIREIQLYAAMAKLGNFAPLQAITISEIDGLSGRKTGNSMINMLDMTGTELRALAGPQAAADLLDQKMRENADFRGNVLSGLRDAVSTDPEDVREFLSYQGIEVAAEATPAELLQQVEAYAQTFGPDATVEANVSISVPVDETKAFDVTIAGITTAEEMTAYLAENGERIDTEIRTALYSDITTINVDDGLSAEELTMLNGWIDTQMEGASDIEKVLLERARGIIEADTNPTADTQIVVQANTALTDDDRVLKNSILQDAQDVLARAGGDVPEAGILAILNGDPMLVRQIDGELVVTQIHRDNFASVLGEGVALDSDLEGKLRERADMGDTEVKYHNVTIGVNPATANLLDTSTITIQEGRNKGLLNTFISESTGKGVIIESKELADAIDHFDGRAPRDERFVTHYNLPGEFDSAAIARGLDALERALDHNGVGSLSVTFAEGANGTTAEINYGDGQKLEIPKGLYDAIMERASYEATHDHSQVVEVSAPTVGMGS